MKMTITQSSSLGRARVPLCMVLEQHRLPPLCIYGAEEALGIYWCAFSPPAQGYRAVQATPSVFMEPRKLWHLMECQTPPAHGSRAVQDTPSMFFELRKLQSWHLMECQTPPVHGYRAAQSTPSRLKS